MTIVTDPATPPLPESTAPNGGRPWPAPSPNSGWWRGEGDAAAERPATLDDDTQVIRTDQFRQQPTSGGAPPGPGEGGRRRTPEARSAGEGTDAGPAPGRTGRHAAQPMKPTITYSQPAATQPAVSPPAEPERTAETLPRRALDARSVGPHTFEFTAPIRATGNPTIEPPTAELRGPLRPTGNPTIEPPTAELRGPVRATRTPAPEEPPTAELPGPVRPAVDTAPAAAAEKPATAATPTMPPAAVPAAAPAAVPAQPEGSAVRPQGGFPLWPEGDGPTVPIMKPESTPADEKAAANPEAGTAWQAAEIEMMRGGRRTTAKRPTQAPKRVRKRARPPALGLTALVLLALLAGFFGWVSADPFWLAVGHAQRGTATVTQCVGDGLQARCVGTFAGSSFSRDRVAVSALPRAEQRPGAKVTAQMVSAKGRIAYAGRPTSLHLRWIVGIVLVVLCGLGIAWATGAGRLESRRARMTAFALSLGGPLLITFGTIAVAW
ncbi:hypothetical protein HC028_03320 [Planosporangium flavigriseum]|uniref:Uncharacterized protein n=1 Tax=Planosporangium flavigriseum TaxID=373681 RepID=A0A8J3PKT8_9ACTN|nr:hypothetical protein [Planosporangium flavigriseum]NJC63545.1 hypothetical protein [Planosporangium flavigriseum]GIG72243.1 hypothetical protein Pfl04_06470 [Planosporangium flavigriseum]